MSAAPNYASKSPGTPMRDIWSSTYTHLIHLDFVGPFLDKMFLILYDSYSRWIEAYPMSNITSEAGINNLRHSIATHWLLYIIVTDNGTSFTSNDFKKFNAIGIKHVTSAPYHPSSNGPTERAVQTFKSSIKKVCENGNSDLITSINCQSFFIVLQKYPT